MSKKKLTEQEKIALINEAHRLLDNINFLLNKAFKAHEKAAKKRKRIQPR